MSGTRKTRHYRVKKMKTRQFINTLKLVLFTGLLCMLGACKPEENTTNNKSENTSISESGPEKNCPEKICIFEPENDSQVTQRTFIRGKVDIPNSDVKIVIHPMEESGQCWVQQDVLFTDSKKGEWAVQARFGVNGARDNGKPFAIKAIANPVSGVVEGEITCWPEGEFSSEAIIVHREP